MKVKVKTWCKNTVDVKQQDRDGGASVKVGGGGLANERGRREFVLVVWGHPPPENFEI